MIYRYLCSRKQASETELPFSASDHAEVVGILSLKLEIWVREFETIRTSPQRARRVEWVVDDEEELARKCEQAMSIVKSMKYIGYLEIKSRQSVDWGCYSRDSHWSTSSSQAGLGLKGWKAQNGTNIVASLFVGQWAQCRGSDASF